MARFLLVVCLLLGAFSASDARAAEHKLRFATLAPKNSSWGKVFKAWQKAVSQQTDGKLELEILYNGVAGAEDAMVSKMKTGQIDGAALTSVGMSRIHRDILVLQLPGVLDSWALLDKARGELRPELEKGFADAGFQILGWGDVGLVRLMSKGFAVRQPSDLRGRSPVVWRDEPMGPIVFATVGGVVPVPLTPMEVLPALRSGKVNVLSGPSLAAEQLQWTSQLDHVGASPSVCAIGGTLIRADALSRLPADLRETFLQIQERAASRQTDRIRKLDAAAWERARKKMTVVELSEADRGEWRKVLKAAVERLAQGTFRKELVERVVKISGKS